MLNKKITQPIMVWFLPVIVFGGILFPLLGYLVLLMMIFFLTLSYFKGRLWCVYLCPRGAFQDLVVRKIGRVRPLPRVFRKFRFKWLLFDVFISLFIIQFIMAEKTLSSIGFVFVRMCLVTTLIAVFMGITIRARAWCAICPMGTLQLKINSLGKR